MGILIQLLFESQYTIKTFKCDFSWIAYSRPQLKLSLLRNSLSKISQSLPALELRILNDAYEILVSYTLER
jgi:hypothetical protein